MKPKRAGEEPPERLGPCRRLQLLAEGAMGAVWLAELVETRPYAAKGTRVALKVLHPQASVGEGTRRFMREAELGQRIRHPAVVRTFEADACIAGPIAHLFLVLEYVDGRTLEDAIKELGRVPEPLLMRWAAQIAAGLVAVHAAGAIHGDVKPSNVLIARDGRVLLSDLGIAQVVGRTSPGGFACTPLYAAPEQFAGEDALTPACDLYSLGVVLHEAATGSNPFNADDALEIMRRHFLHAPPGVRELAPELSPFFAELVATLLAKEPSRRLSSAAKLNAVLAEGAASRWWRERERAAAPGRAARWSPSDALEAALVGREEDLGWLRGLYREARGRRGGVALIEAEAGMGKTRLVDEFLRGLDSGTHVLAGAHRGGAPGAAPCAMLQALAEHLGERTLEPTLERHLAGAPRLAPGLAALVAGAAPAAQAQSLSYDALRVAVGHLVRSLAAERPVVWVVEDLHQGSADSLALLLSIARLAHELRLLLVATTRPRAAGAAGPACEELAELARLPVTRRRCLRPLEPSEVGELLRRHVRSSEVAARLGPLVVERSGGNPLFVREMVRALLERGALERDEDGSFRLAADPAQVSVPASVQELLVARVASLTREDRELLEVAALEGPAFDPDLVARAVGCSAASVVRRLVELERHPGLVRAVLRPGAVGFAFDHPWSQEALSRALPDARRERYHAALARARAAQAGLEGREPSEVPGEAAVRLATHLLEGGRVADGARLLPRALDHLEERLQLDALVRLVDLAWSRLGEAEPALRGRLRLRQARAFSRLGRRVQERAALEEAVRCARGAGDAAGGGRALCALGESLLATADYARAREALEAAGALASSAADYGTTARAYAWLGSVLTEQGRYREARVELERSVELARDCGDRAGEANALGRLGALQLELGENGAALEAYRGELRAAIALGDRAAEAKAVASLAAVLHALGRYEESLEQHERHLELCRESGTQRGEIAVARQLARIYQQIGRLDLAGKQHERHLALARALEDRRDEARALQSLAALSLHEGRLDQAGERLAASLALARALGALALEADAVAALGELGRARGQDDEARELLEQALALRRRMGAAKPVTRALVALGRHVLEQGETASARSLLLEAESLATGCFEGAPLAAAYLALLGEREPAEVTLAPGAPAPERVEAHLVLHRAGERGRDHLEKAGLLLGLMSAHLRGAALEAFRRGNPLARMYRDLSAERDRAREDGAAPAPPAAPSAGAAQQPNPSSR